jgi:hydroxyethylthiazole kinase-like uncharacterized protein yjeF
MRPVLTAEDAATLEREAEARGTSVETLMERAGHAVAREAVRLAGGAYGHRAVVVAGKGNNAGDGFVAARHMAAWGMSVTVLLVGDPGDIREPGATNLHRLSQTTVRPYTDATADRELERAHVAIDAIFGLGLRGAPKDPFAAAIAALDRHDVPTVSVDIPSGVESDTGASPGTTVHPSVTVTFGAPKIGNILPPGAYPYGSRLVVADIGYPAELVQTFGPTDWPITLLERGDVALPPPRRPDAHKRDAVVLVIGGSRRMAGAPSLVARGAYRAGAGLVILAVPESILPVVQSAVREATFLPLPDDGAGIVAEAAWDSLQEVLPDVHAVAVGPGLSTGGEAPTLVRRLVRESPVPLVIDADAINAFEGRPGDLADRAADAVITPHHGELARLMGISADTIRADLLGSVRAAAREIDGPVLLKGWPTLLAVPEGDIKIERSGTPVLATAGTGDVLTGVIAGFLAPGFVRDGYRRGLARPDHNAVAAAQIHGLAGRIAGARLGEGTTASDVADAVPAAIRRMRGDV